MWEDMALGFKSNCFVNFYIVQIFSIMILKELYYKL